jgi:hypothetical protein
MTRNEPHNSYFSRGIAIIFLISEALNPLSSNYLATVCVILHERRLPVKRNIRAPHFHEQLLVHGKHFSSPFYICILILVHGISERK